jgi:hypothetical protein
MLKTKCAALKQGAAFLCKLGWLVERVERFCKPTESPACLFVQQTAAPVGMLPFGSHSFQTF